MHCYTLTADKDEGVTQGIAVSRQLDGEVEQAGLQVGSFFQPFSLEYGKAYLDWVAKHHPPAEVVHNLAFDDHNQAIAANPKERSDFALTMVNIAQAEGGRVEVTASVKEELFDDVGMVQRRYRNIGDAKGIRIIYPAVLKEGVDIGSVMAAAAGGEIHRLAENVEKEARDENLEMLSRWSGPMLLVMHVGSSFRVFRTGRLGGGPKIFSFRWLWRRPWRTAKLFRDVHDPRESMPPRR